MLVAKYDVSGERRQGSNTNHYNILSIMEKEFKPGDYVYYRKDCGYNQFDTIPAIVVRVTKCFLILNDGGERDSEMKASKSRCEHQI